MIPLVFVRLARPHERLCDDMEDSSLFYYKGYTAAPEYSTEEHIFYGKILGISDLVDFQSESAKDIEREFHNAVDDYLEFCAEIGRTPPTRA